MADSKPELYFDGCCKMCNGLVKFVDGRKSDDIVFKPLESEEGEKFLQENGIEADSIVFSQDGNFYLYSDAVVKVLKHMRGFWPYFGVLLGFTPKTIRDAGYRLVASARNLFGNKKVCSKSVEN